MGRRLPRLLAAALRPARTRLTSTNHPHDTEGGHPGAVGAGAHPGTPGTAAHPPPHRTNRHRPENGSSTISNQTSEPLNN